SQPVPDYAPIQAASDRAGAALTKIASSRSLPTKVYTSTDEYRRYSDKADQKKDTEIIKKDTGLGKKKYRKYRIYKKNVMKVSNSSETSTPKPYEVKSQEEAPSAFPEMLGFDPYQPPVAFQKTPVVSQKHPVAFQKAPVVFQKAPVVFQKTYNPSGSHSSVARAQESRNQSPSIAQESYLPSPSYPSTSKESRSSAPKIVPSPQVPDFASASAPVKEYSSKNRKNNAPVKKYSSQNRKNNDKPNKNNKENKNGSYTTHSKYMSRKTYSSYTDLGSDDEDPTVSPGPSDSVSSASSLTEDEVSGLAFDLESGRIFNHKTGKWYTLVPVQKE
ncbi:unnamed protein product, partial [Meganyctiphanes norvegica]